MEEQSNKRSLEIGQDGSSEEPSSKVIKRTCTHEPPAPKYANLKHGKGRPVPVNVQHKLSEEDVKLLEEVKTSCTDLAKIQAAMQLRINHRLCIRLPEDEDDTTYYIENGLRKVYPYNYLYQSYAKRRWLGRKLRDVIKQEFRDISDESLKSRFDSNKILVRGVTAKFDHVLKDNDFIANITHRHELAVLATPIKVIFEDKDTFVIDKPPSLPIHPCGRFRHNSVSGILTKEYGIKNLKIVHRLDRLVSGVLITALNSRRAHELEVMMKNRDVQKEYVCRVDGKFPLGDGADDGFITVDQPLDTVPGKIGVVVAIPEGKPSVTSFKLLNYNGKTSAVLCRPRTGRMHQIRVHLQYLGHPITNDSLYNCNSFGPEKGKGGRYGKSLKQISDDVLEKHRASHWLMGDVDSMDPIEPASEDTESGRLIPVSEKSRKFLSEEERKETMDALAHYFTKESWEDLEQKLKFDPTKMTKDESCRDCQENYHDPPLRNLFLYLHAIKYSGTGFCYQSEMPVWAKDTWTY